MGLAEQAPSCIFCKIIKKEIPAEIIGEKDNCLAIRDVNPQAPTHFLVIPKEHIRNIVEYTDTVELGKLLSAATEFAKLESLNSFRIVVNTGEDAGQTVFHLHIHVIGGRTMHWPPG